MFGTLLWANTPRVDAAPILTTQVGLNPTGAANEGVIYDFGTESAAATLHYEYTAEGAGTASIYDGSAEARAGFGELRVKATATLVDYRPGSYQVDETSPIPFPAYASASFTDTLTVQGGTGAGLLVFSYAVTGTVTNGPFMGPGAIATQTVGGESVRLTPGNYTGDSVAVSDPVPFTFGTPLEIQVTFLGNVFVTDLFAEDPYSTAGDANFLSTLILSEIRPTDLAGNPLAGVTIASESGTAYPVNSIPEPSSWILLVLGLICPRANVRRSGARRRG